MWGSAEKNKKLINLKDQFFLLKIKKRLLYSKKLYSYILCMQITSLSFLKSASKVADCPPVSLPEFAVIGRSNVGKSTLINMLMNQTIAKSSDKPWKTQLINYFLVNENWYFVDLPGYGYAKVSLESRRKRINETYEYFLQRKPYIFVLVDGSIPPQKIDLEFIAALEEEKLSYALIITKADKANQKTLSQNTKLLRQQLQKITKKMPEIILSSSVKKTGRNQILDLIEAKIAEKTI